MTNIQKAALDYLFRELRIELEKAITKHPTFPTAHHGYAVIKEELDELWEEVRKDYGTLPGAQKEALQIAAMGLRYALDLTVIGNPTPLAPSTHFPKLGYCDANMCPGPLADNICPCTGQQHCPGE